jgi:predicted dehydrogenase
MAGSGPLRVAIVGAGLIGNKRAAALGDEDVLIACCDPDVGAAERLVAAHGGSVSPTVEDLLAEGPDVTVVATPHHLLAELSVQALEAGSHVLVEKPAGISAREIEMVREAAAEAGRRVKVGFNHRFHPGLARAVAEARSGDYGEIMFARGRYGHGGRLGYETEWRMRPELSGGGEMIDQGMHMLDLCFWLLGDLPVHSALLRTQFWDAVVEDNAVIVLGAQTGPAQRAEPWATFHVSWSEWKNMFSLEIYCRTAKFVVEGLAGSYGPQSLTIYRMSPELGPPARERIDYPAGDPSWEAEWRHFRSVLLDGSDEPLLGDLASAPRVAGEWEGRTRWRAAGAVRGESGRMIGGASTICRRCRSGFSQVRVRGRSDGHARLRPEPTHRCDQHDRPARPRLARPVRLALAGIGGV